MANPESGDLAKTPGCQTEAPCLGIECMTECSSSHRLEQYAGQYAAADEPTWEQLEAGRPPRKLTPEDYQRAAEIVCGKQQQEAVSPAAGAVMLGPVDSSEHGAVQAELRQVQVAVRGQMDGIRPIEAAVLTYRWTPAEHWIFEELQPLVQGLEGALKPGTVLSAHDMALLGPSLGWAWDLVHQLRPRG